MIDRPHTPARTLARGLRRAVLALPICLTAAALPDAVRAQAAPAWPTKPVTIVAAYPPGGVADQMARVMATEFGKRWNQPVTVENRTGASGMIGANHVAKSAPDGHVLLMAAMAEIVFTPYTHEKMPYQPQRDLTPVAMAVRYPFLLVANPAFPARTTADVIAAARKSPGEHTYATSGPGSVQHIAMEMFARMAGVQLRHVPYKGVGPALMDVVGNQVSLMFAGFPPGMAQVQAGKLTPIGVTTRERFKTAPDVPSIAETPGLERYDFPAWVALFAPAGTPPAVLDRLNREAVEILATPSVRAGIEKAGMTTSAESRAELAAFMKSESDKYRKVIGDAGIRGE